MANFILLLVCLLGGFICRQIPSFPPRAHEGLNAFIIYFSLPAISLLYIPQMQLTWASLFPFVTGWIVLVGAFLAIIILDKTHPVDRKVQGCLILACGFGNISFVGFPIIEALYGKEGLQIAVLVDQGTFLAVASVGVAVAMYYSQGQVKTSVIIKRILYFPPFIAFVLALMLSSFTFPVGVQIVLKKIGDTLSPLALFSVGLQLQVNARSINWRFFSLGLLYKLFLAPALVTLLFLLIFRNLDLQGKVSILEAAMAPMVTSSILAVQYKLHPTLANSLVGFGIPISFISLLFWWFIIENYLAFLF